MGKKMGTREADQSRAARSVQDGVPEVGMYPGTSLRQSAAATVVPLPAPPRELDTGESLPVCEVAHRLGATPPTTPASPSSPSTHPKASNSTPSSSPASKHDLKTRRGKTPLLRRPLPVGSERMRDFQRTGLGRGAGLTSGWKATSPLRPQKRDHFPAGFSISDKVRIQGHDFGIFMCLRHSDQAGIG